MNIPEVKKLDGSNVRGKHTAKLMQLLTRLLINLIYITRIEKIVGGKWVDLLH